MPTINHPIFENQITKDDFILFQSFRPASCFYQDNESLISAIAPKWSFERKDDICRGLPTYSIFKLSKKGKQEIGVLHFCCKTLLLGGKGYRIEPEKIKALLETDFKKARSIAKRFNSRKEGRRFWEKEREKTNILHPARQEPHWIRYDGFFQVTFPLIQTASETAINPLVQEQSQALLDLLNENKAKHFSAEKEISWEAEFLHHGQFAIEEKPRFDATRQAFTLKVYCSKGFYEEMTGIEKRHFHTLEPWTTLSYTH